MVGDWILVGANSTRLDSTVSSLEEPMVVLSSLAQHSYFFLAASFTSLRLRASHTRRDVGYQVLCSAVHVMIAVIFFLAFRAHRSNAWC